MSLLGAVVAFHVIDRSAKKINRKRKYCKSKNCDNKVYGKGYCRKHYKQYVKK